MDAKLVVHVHYAEERYLSLGLIGSNRSFLEATLARCRSDGEYEPPWVVFPGSHPGIGWNQGVQEAWSAEVWSRFWQALPPDRRGAYLDEWQAPEEWRSGLNFMLSR